MDLSFTRMKVVYWNQMKKSVYILEWKNLIWFLLCAEEERIVERLQGESEVISFCR